MSVRPFVSCLVYPSILNAVLIGMIRNRDKPAISHFAYSRVFDFRRYSHLSSSSFDNVRNTLPHEGLYVKHFVAFAGGFFAFNS